MAFGRAFLVLAVLACLSLALGFVSPSFKGLQTESASTRSSTELMACRFNAKKSKRQRNRENMAKFRTRKGSVSRRKLAKQKASENERTREMEFMGKLYSATGNEGAEESS
ncbi:unnamed protein product [Heterosigma akashiwo]|uniref:BZIP domain-containing protein n=1 Tax=Heterosigma akashiwo TaxID=2829 RepID=A0A6V3EWP4_HETAK|mmetsp:Transcript_6219/g.8636  ORF Transcript_6219/g.8636 Transcript_6219/m.8636 type:complete len:111 (+) Transcript_6219:51-383(+)